MDDQMMVEQEKQLLRWGGLAGILSSVLFLVVMVFVTVFIGSDPTDPAGWVSRFPEIHMFRVIENGIYLTGLLLGVLFFLTVFRVLRSTSLAPAMFGSALGIVGLISMIVSATPHVAHSYLSEFYHMADATPEAQAMIAIMWQGTWGHFYAPLYVGFFAVSIGILLVGVAMFSTPSFGKGLRWLSVVLGGAGFIAAILQMVDPASFVGALSYFSFIIFFFITGMRVRRISRL